MVAGRCFCGAVRFQADGEPASACHCHCGMCRRWSGGAFATLVWFKRTDVHWTGAAPVLYRSSPIAVRTRCGVCGSPLALDYDGSLEHGLAIGSLERPEDVFPDHHYGSEGRLPWADIGRDLPAETTKERW